MPEFDPCSWVTILSIFGIGLLIYLLYPKTPSSGGPPHGSSGPGPMYYMRDDD